MKQYQLSRLKHTAQFGEYLTHETVNGISVSSFKQLFTKRFGYVTQSINSQLSNTGVNQTYQKAIFVRHDKRLKDTLVVVIDDVEYQIASLNINDDLNGYDTLTLKRKTGIK